MKTYLLIGSILFFSLVACASSANIATATVPFQTPTVDEQQVMEMTREYAAMQTIVALQQSTKTPTPEALSNLTNPWTEMGTRTITPPSYSNSVIGMILKPDTPLRQGPGDNYASPCNVDMGMRLKIVGRNDDSTWFRIAFAQGQTCFTYSNSARLDNTPDPTLQYWILSTACTVLGDLTEVPVFTPVPSPSPTRYYQITQSLPTATQQNNPNPTKTPRPTNTPIPTDIPTAPPPPTNTPVPPTPAPTESLEP